MKKFYKIAKLNLKDKIIIIIIFIIFFDILLFSFLKKNLSNNIVNISKIKIKEISNYYLNQTLKKYLNYDVDDYILLNVVNNNIYSVNINNTKVNKLLAEIINDLERNSEDILIGNIDFYNMELLKKNKGFIMFVPIGVGANNALFSTLGPKIPIKLSFLENISAYADIIVNNYGINNSLVKLYININIEQIIQMPINLDKEIINYKFLISSKLINGKVPNIIGNGLNAESNIVKNNVN